MRRPSFLPIIFRLRFTWCASLMYCLLSFFNVFFIVFSSFSIFCCIFALQTYTNDTSLYDNGRNIRTHTILREQMYILRFLFNHRSAELARPLHQRCSERDAATQGLSGKRADRDAVYRRRHPLAAERRQYNKTWERDNAHAGR